MSTPTPPPAPTSRLPLGLDALTRSQRLTMGAAVVFTVVSGIAHTTSPDSVATFLIAAVALATLAAVVGQSIEQVGERLGPGATGLLQSALGNLPELFVGYFALKAGLVDVVRAALVGSILANTLLVLGAAVLLGGLKHGPQRFESDAPRMIGTLLLLAVAALLVPTLAFKLHTPAASHAEQLSGAVAIVLVVVYLLSIPFWLRSDATAPPANEDKDKDKKEKDGEKGDKGTLWPLPVAIGLLAFGSLGSALVSDWFVAALEPATKSLGLSPIFTGLVIVAIASNAVENVGGIGFALRARPDYALSTILNSPLQVALFLTPLLVLISHLTGPTHLTLVFPTLQVAALAVAVIAVIVVLSDGEYVWLEGVALIGLYCILAAAFWWG
jgi:Ca2+:H+ antiporter